MGRKNEKFRDNVIKLRNCIFMLLVIGAAISVFGLVTWKTTQNGMLKSIGLTGIVAILASIIGLIGCKR